MNGVVNYGAHQDHSDKTVQYALGNYLKPEAKTITLKANEERIVNVTLKTPPKVFKGQLVGGISAVEIPKDQKTSQQINIRNKFAYAVAVVVRNNNHSVTPEFKLGQVEANQMMAVTKSALTFATYNQSSKTKRRLRLSSQNGVKRRSSIKLRKKMFNSHRTR